MRIDYKNHIIRIYSNTCTNGYEVVRYSATDILGNEILSGFSRLTTDLLTVIEEIKQTIDSSKFNAPRYTKPVDSVISLYI